MDHLPEVSSAAISLAVEGLFFHYRNREVLKGVGFRVHQGELCGLLGPNGSGKTTLLKCLNGILKPSAGRVLVQGKDLAAHSRGQIARRIAVVPQELALAFPFTVHQMVLMGGSVRYGISGIPRETDRQHALGVLEDLGIGQLAPRRFNELSGGERQMVLIARALFQDTEILLLDEPTSHLDFKRQFTTLETVSRITRERGLTTIMTLHDPNSAGRYCDRLIMLKQGHILQQGRRDHVFQVGHLEEVYDMRIHMGRTDAGTCFVTPSEEA
nr:ABC transporter ATP-binding protein [uncultured Holophaga sp.]